MSKTSVSGLSLYEVAELKHAAGVAAVECDVIGDKVFGPPEFNFDCEFCTHSYVTGDGGPFDNDVAHCRECCRSWPRSSQQCHCCVCHKHFVNERHFTRHQRVGDDGQTVCLDPGSAVNRAGNPMFGLKPHAAGSSRFGDVWGSYVDPDAPKPDFWS